MNKILIIKHDGSTNISLTSLKSVAKSIYDIWAVTGIVAIPSHFDYEFLDCDKFMGVRIDKEIANERFENECFEEPCNDQVKAVEDLLKEVDALPEEERTYISW